MTNTNIKKLRTVSLNERGQIVIPEDIRKDFGLKGETTLVIIEKEDELVLKKESKVLEAFEKEAMKRAWSKEDEIWDALAETSLKEVWDNEKDEKVWKKYL